MLRSSEIKIKVELDEKNMPLKIEWEADDSNFSGSKEAKTMMLSLWDKDDNLTMAIDLWTKEMLVDEMNVHFTQIFDKMADTYQRATNNNEGAKLISEFAGKFSRMIESTKKNTSDN